MSAQIDISFEVNFKTKTDATVLRINDFLSVLQSRPIQKLTFKKEVNNY